MLTLYDHQKKLVQKNPRRHLLAHSTGTGKTITALSLANHNHVDALIIVPKALKENWQRALLNFDGHQHMVISKEEFRKTWDDLPFFDAIIPDEFHFFANEKSQMSKAFRKYVKKHNPKYIWGLTATPYCSSAMNIYTLANHLGHNLNYWSFFNKFFYQVRMGTRMVPVQRKDIQGELAELVKSIGSTVTLEECADVPDQVFETVYLELTKAQESAIKQIDDSQAITRWTRKHTIENGIKIGDEYTMNQYFDCLKNDYIVSFAEENKKFAVFCRYNLQIEMLKNLLEKAGKKVFVINGEVKNRDEVVQQIESSPECIAIIQASCSVGFEIPSVPIVIFASLSFSFIDYKQALGRVLRINRLKKNVYIHLIIKGGVDEDVYKCIMNKQDFSIAIYNKEI